MYKPDRRCRKITALYCLSLLLMEFPRAWDAYTQWLDPTQARTWKSVFPLLVFGGLLTVTAVAAVVVAIEFARERRMS